MYADYLFAVKLAKVKTFRERKALAIPWPEKKAFRSLRAQDPNVVMPIHLWTNECNDGDEDGWRCHNTIRHKTLLFKSVSSWRVHVHECFVYGKLPKISKTK